MQTCSTAPKRWPEYPGIPVDDARAAGLEQGCVAAGGRSNPAGKRWFQGVGRCQKVSAVANKPSGSLAGGVSDAVDAVLLTLPTALAAAAAPARQPNIVFIFADDWGWGDLSCHGHPWLKTPNLDRLAGAGIDFQQFNVLNPVCSPSRTAATTGMYPARFCIHQHFAAGINVERGMPDWLDPHAPTLARFLKDAGYRTGHFGKWHLTNAGSVGAPEPSAYGFDESAVFNGPGVEAGLHDTADSGPEWTGGENQKKMGQGYGTWASVG